LNSIREARVHFVYTSLNQNIIKQSIALFLSEVLGSALREEDKNPNLFEYLQTTFQWLETHDHVSNFHLLFLLNLTRHLGFYPETKNLTGNYFNLEEGYFADYKPFNMFIEGENLVSFKSLIGTNFDVLDRLNFSVRSRQSVLNDLITYYELHLPGFKKPRSLDILKDLFKK
jgi:DNA repair protein RecO (recombination protein O)